MDATVLSLIPYIGLSLQIGILLALIYKRQWKDYASFFGYTAFVVLTFPMFNYFHYFQSQNAYYWFYYLQEAGSILLTLMVQLEILYEVFDQYQGIRKFGVQLFVLFMLVLIAVAAWSSVSFEQHALPRYSKIVFAALTSLRFIHIGWILFLMFFMRSLALVWKTEYFTMAVGLCLNSCVRLFYFLCLMQYGNDISRDLYNILAIGYFGAQLLWAVAIMRPVSALKSVDLPEFDHLEKWNRLLSKI